MMQKAGASVRDVDALYTAFCSTLPPGMRDVATDLPRVLGLAPCSGVRWSAVFKHDITLSAPALVAEGMSGAVPGHVERAVFAHLLSVVEAFGTDRVADGQVPDTATLRGVLAELREARDAALVELAGRSFRETAQSADRQTRDAIALERDVLLRGEPVTLENYAEISAGKQALGMLASVALAAAHGWGAPALATVRSTLMSSALGLQFQDDVADWEDDALRGGAWAIVLHGRVAQAAVIESTNGFRRSVFSSAILADMLELSRREYEKAALGAESLGAHRLARWALERASEAHEQAEGERSSPGYVSRSKKLNAWKMEVVG